MRILTLNEFELVAGGMRPQPNLLPVDGGDGSGFYDDGGDFGDGGGLFDDVMFIDTNNYEGGSIGYSVDSVAPPVNGVSAETIGCALGTYTFQLATYGNPTAALAGCLFGAFVADNPSYVGTQVAKAMAAKNQFH